MTEPGHNSGAQLKSIVERVERIGEDIKGLRDDQKDIFAEAKSSGYCPRTLRKIVALRQKDPAVRAEENALLEAYLAALGMEA